MEIPPIKARPDYFSIFGILGTIALICLCISCIAHAAKQHSIDSSSSALPTIAIATTPLMMHDESRAEAGTTFFSSPILQPGEIDNSRKLESTPSLSKTLSQSLSPQKISNAVEKAIPPSLSRSETNRRNRRSFAKTRVAPSRSFAANLRRIIVSFQLRSSAIRRRTF
jgi:hypothetical protein